MKYIALLLLLIVTQSHGAICVHVTATGSVRSTGVPMEECSDFVLVSRTEYESMNVQTVVATLIDLFGFSVEDFAYFNAICLIGFIGGHSLGRVARLLGKT
ncbi:hypothetical protein [Thalassomonas sp. RHCl1]|uniref:hypothetical protein n=1 Tax=Thalassomonas sp. RHCl1 TaxID=2995320 RepID=UPI00248BD994|nr:hypothetical protein [Thalassomonas sp. RHCl1]